MVSMKHSVSDYRVQDFDFAFFTTDDYTLPFLTMHLSFCWQRCFYIPDYCIHERTGMSSTAAGKENTPNSVDLSCWPPSIDLCLILWKGRTLHWLYLVRMVGRRAMNRMVDRCWNIPDPRSRFPRKIQLKDRYDINILNDQYNWMER